MKILEFDYTKKDGEKTHRNVMVINEKDNYIDAIDYGYLSPTEITRVEELKAKFERDMKPFSDKAFRRFSRDGIDNLEEQKK